MGDASSLFQLHLVDKNNNFEPRTYLIMPQRYSHLHARSHETKHRYALSESPIPLPDSIIYDKIHIKIIQLNSLMQGQMERNCVQRDSPEIAAFLSGIYELGW